MPKLQRIKRANGSVVFSVNIPLEIIEELGWEKGIKLFLETHLVKNNKIILMSKKEVEND